MTHQVEVAADGVRVPLTRRRVAEIALTVLEAERARSTHLSIAFVSTRAIADLNAHHLGHAGPTDVISFAMRAPERGGPIVGDVYIAPEVAKRNAAEQGTSTREEVTRLVVHGVLHVLGYDHPEGRGRDNSRMWRRQEALVTRLTREHRHRRQTRQTA
jgi:probable rRNA maturation factor